MSEPNNSEGVSQQEQKPAVLLKSESNSCRQRLHIYGAAGGQGQLVCDLPLDKGLSPPLC